jgi:hypothetical protein
MDTLQKCNERLENENYILQDNKNTNDKYKVIQNTSVLDIPLMILTKWLGYNKSADV